MRRAGVRVTLLLAGLVLLSTTAVPVSGTYVCEDRDGYNLERGDGSWVVNGGGSVLTHAAGSDWDRPETVDPDDEWPAGGLTAVTIEGLTRGPDGDWWVLGDDGRIAGFTGNWSFAGERYRFDGDPVLVHDVARTQGRWWVLYGDVSSGDSLVVFDDTWSEVTRYQLDGKYTGMTVADGALWTVSSDGTVTTFDVERGRPSKRGSVRGAIGRELADPQDLHRGPRGDWWVLSEGGGIAGYTPDWEHTGYQYGALVNPPGCGERNPDGSEWLAVAHLLVVGTGIAVSFRTHREKRTRYTRVGLGVGSLAVAGVLFNFSLPELFSWLYRLPDVAVSVPLVTAALLLSTMPYLSRNDRSVVDVLVHLTITAPLWIAGLLF